MIENKLEIQAPHSEQAYSIHGDIQTSSNIDAMTSPALVQQHQTIHSQYLKNQNPTLQINASYKDPQQSQKLLSQLNPASYYSAMPPIHIKAPPQIQTQSEPGSNPNHPSLHTPHQFAPSPLAQSQFAARPAEIEPSGQANQSFSSLPQQPVHNDESRITSTYNDDEDQCNYNLAPGAGRYQEEQLVQSMQVQKRHYIPPKRVMIKKKRETEEQEEEISEEEKMLRYLMEQKGLPKLMKGSNYKLWREVASSPSPAKIQATISHMRKVIQELQTKDSQVKKEIEKTQNQNDKLGKQIIEADIAIEKCEKGRELDSKYLFQQDEVLTEMQKQIQKKKGPSKTTVASKLKPSLVATRPDPALVKSNKLLTQRVQKMEYEINNAFSEMLEGQSYIGPKIGEITENLISQNADGNDKMMNALTGQLKLAAKTYETNLKCLSGAVQKGRNQLCLEIQGLQEAQMNFMQVKQDCVEDKKQLFTEERELGSVQVDYMVSQGRGLNHENEAIDEEKLQMACVASDVLARLKMKLSSHDAADQDQMTFIEKLPNQGQIMESDSVSELLKK